MSDYKQVPLAAAQAIAEQFNKTQVVILAWDPVHERMQATTYGVSESDKENAAAAGELLSDAIRLSKISAGRRNAVDHQARTG